jgi:hypothetical protein
MEGTFKEKFESIKGTPKGMLLSLGIILGINTLILFVPLGECLIILLLPLTAFGIQYLFGERTMKRFVLMGLLALFLTGLILAGTYTYQIYGYTNYEPVKAHTDDNVLVLRDGDVKPRGFTENMVYNFTVTYIDPVGLPNQIIVNIYSPAIGFDKNYSMLPVDNSTDTASGKDYYFETPLAESLFFFSYYVENSTSAQAISEGTFGDYELGPVNLSAAQFIIIGLSYVPFLAMIYLLFILLYWWTQKARTYQPPRPPEETKDEEEFTCSKCGADVPGDATRCPKCGEEFEEDEEEEEKEKKETVMASKTDMGYCRVCNRRVNKGDMMLGCQCGRAYHLRCANKVGKCPACGTEFS